jgi:hypothetical protein
VKQICLIGGKKHKESSKAAAFDRVGLREKFVLSCRKRPQAAD